jgi:hypothetical protein
MSPLLADFVAKVENRTTRKILAEVDLWASLLLRRFSMPLWRSVTGFGRNDMTSLHVKCIAALRIFVRHTKKTFATNRRKTDIANIGADVRFREADRTSIGVAELRMVTEFGLPLTEFGHEHKRTV